ncbi:MAG: hypothetical protein ABIG65_01450 [Patescibacteria group bacterium]
MKNKVIFSVKRDLVSTIDKVFGAGIINIVNLTAFSVSAGTAVFC